MKALREKDSVAANQLAKLWSDSSQYEKAIASLLDDGLIEKRGKSYSLAR